MQIDDHQTKLMTAAGLNLIAQALTIYDADLRLVLCNAPFQQMFDLDGDGQLSQHELAKAAKLFAMVDKDGDGQLTEEELKQVHLFFDPVFLTIRLKSCTDAPRALL